MLILKENDLEKFVKEVEEPEGDEAKANFKKNMIRTKRIIANSIKDHLIPHVSSLDTPKEMLEALTKLYEGKNINRKMTLRTQLKNVKMQKFETIHSYFTRVSQINGQIETTSEKVESAELAMITPKVMGSLHQRVVLKKEVPNIQFGKNVHKKKPD